MAESARYREVKPDVSRISLSQIQREVSNELTERSLLNLRPDIVSTVAQLTATIPIARGENRMMLLPILRYLVASVNANHVTIIKLEVAIKVGRDILRQHMTPEQIQISQGEDTRHVLETISKTSTLLLPERDRPEFRRAILRFCAP